MYFSYYRKLFILMACFLFLCIAQEGFANLTVPINGKVESYKKGVYTVRTNEALIYIKKSKISFALDKKLNKNIGNRVQVNVPPGVISSYRQLNRRPSSVEEKEDQ